MLREGLRGANFETEVVEHRCRTYGKGWIREQRIRGTIFTDLRHRNLPEMGEFMVAENIFS